MDFSKLSFNLIHIAFTISITASAVTMFWKNDFRMEKMETKQVTDKRLSDEIAEINRKFLFDKIEYNDGKMIRKFQQNLDYF